MKSTKTLELDEKRAQADQEAASDDAHTADSFDQLAQEGL